MTARCAQCRFWEARGKDEFGKRRGECRRHAPRPSQSQMHDLLQFAGAIAWAIEEMANIEHDQIDKNYCADGSDQHDLYEWPRTLNYDWCGEFEPGKCSTWKERSGWKE